MKKVFPIIVLLITLSVLGIIFIQMSWIRTAINLRKQQREQDIATAINRIKEECYQRYFAIRGQYPTNEESKLFLLRDFSTTYIAEDMDDVVIANIKRSGIKEKFEYSIIDIYRNPIVTSKNFKNEYYTSAIQTQLL